MTLSRTRGFALLELLVVILIIGMVSGILVPSMSRTMTSVRLKTASRNVLNIMRIARETSVREQAIQQVQVDFINQEILLTDEFGKATSRYPIGEDVKVEAIRIEGNPAVRSEVVSVLFYPEGNAVAAEIVLRTPDTQDRMIVRTDAVTGTAKLIAGKDWEER